jgi:peptidoglycan/LPS O-acetylase OafA/YrhL
LDGLRGLAALFVVFHHAYLQVNDREPFTGLAARILYVFFYGRYSVDLFIVLSGFCLMLPVVKGDGTIRGGALNFFKRRAWRILPTYYLAAFFSWVLAAFIISQKTGTHWDMSVPVTTQSIAAHLLLIHDIVGQDYTINHAFWSIAVEWRIYFLFPGLLIAWRSLGGGTTTVLATAASYALFFVARRVDPEGLTAYYLGLFALGMLSANIAFSASAPYERLRKWRWGWFAFLATLGVLLASKMRIWHGATIPYFLQDGLVGLWAMCLLILLARGQGDWMNRFLSYKPIAFLGTFAYSIYLIHAPLLQVLWQYVFTPWQDNPVGMFLALASVGVFLILAASYLFFLICERPFVHRKRSG